MEKGRVGRVILFIALWLLYGLLWVIHAGSSILQWFFNLLSVPASIQFLSPPTLLAIGAVLLLATFIGKAKSGLARLFSPIMDRWARFKSRNGFLVLSGSHGVLSIGKKGRPPALEEYAAALLDALPRESVFFVRAQTLQGQVARLARKKEALSLALSSRFGDSGITLQKFAGGAKMAEDLMFGNTVDVIKRIWTFDEQDYAEIEREHGRIATERTRARLAASGDGDNARLQEREQVVKEKMALYQSALAYVEQGVQSNEKVLLQLDRLQEELASLSDAGNVENLAAMREIETLIADTKWYRDNGATG
ncbi:MAG: hypothetical protein LBI92_06500 [Azoarcus sp.]|nr:hypothetical protein [Azoarcus sp.]